MNLTVARSERNVSTVPSGVICMPRVRLCSMTSPSPLSTHLEALLADAPASMTVRQVAETLAVSEHVVRRLLVSTDLQGVKVGREWRVFRDDLLYYLTARSNSTEGRS